jgi:hypothetical protein
VVLFISIIDSINIIKMKNKLLAIGFALVISAGIWLPGLSYAQTAANNFGITPGMSDMQIIQILTQVVAQLMEQIQVILAKQAQGGQGSGVSPTPVPPTPTPVPPTPVPIGNSTGVVAPMVSCTGPTQDIVAGPLGNLNGTGPFEQLGLTTSTHPEILQYRIKWFDGSWSPWYVPGVNDRDWEDNPDGTARRIWSYFDDHTHEYILCSNTVGFNSTNPTITVPSGGEKWVIGTPHTIQWSSPIPDQQLGCWDNLSLVSTATNTATPISVGFLSGMPLLDKNQTSYTWDTQTLYSLSCGTNATQSIVQPGQYEIQLNNSNGVVATSKPFNLVSPLSPPVQSTTLPSPTLNYLPNAGAPGQGAVQINISYQCGNTYGLYRSTDGSNWTQLSKTQFTPNAAGSCNPGLVDYNLPSGVSTLYYKYALVDPSSGQPVQWSAVGSVSTIVPEEIAPPALTTLPSPTLNYLPNAGAPGQGAVQINISYQCGNTYGLYRSTDGSNWTQLSKTQFTPNAAGSCNPGLVDYNLPSGVSTLYYKYALVDPSSGQPVQWSSVSSVSPTERG